MTDFDKLFEDYIKNWLESHKGEYTADEAENMIPDLYEKFVTSPCKEAGGKTPEEFFGEVRDAAKLVSMNYTSDNSDFSSRGVFRINGDTLSIRPADRNDTIIRVEFFGDEIDRITECDAVNYKARATLSHAAIFPASHYATTDAKMERAVDSILAEMEERVQYFKDQGKLLEAYRLEQRTRYDMELLRETKSCSGIENYSRHISGRAPGSAPYTLMDYFPKDFLVFIDESHATIPQVRAMYNGDRARKESLVEYGFRLPSALDNRPLKFDEFEERIHQVIYVSATPAKYERERASEIVEQVIRPTGLIDPEIIVRPVEGQIDDLIGEIRQTTPPRGSASWLRRLLRKWRKVLLSISETWEFASDTCIPTLNLLKEWKL